MSAEFMEVRPLVLVANVPQRIDIVANFFQLMQASADVTIEFFHNNTRVGIATDMPEGFRRGPVKEGKEWNRVQITSAVGQTIQYCLAFGEASLQRLTGNITATVTKAGTYVQYDRAISIPFGGAAPLLLLPANAARREALIRNHSSSAGDLMIGNADVAILKSHVFLPGESVILTHADDIYVKGSAVNVHVDFSEILD